jgi:glycosyltransferase involved in cell wall biosynthesis
MSRVSVVIPTRGRPDLIGRSVRAVLANDHPDFDVVVVDQSDDDRTGEVVRDLAHVDRRLRYVHTQPPGLSRAYNIGVRLTTAPILAFTDDDCVAAPDWVRSVARAFDDDPTAEMLYGTVALPRDLEASPGQVPVLPIARAERLDRRNGFRIYGMGANYALRRSLFERVGGFDEILGGGGPLRSSQDFDFQFRAYRADAVVLLRPEVVVEHYGLRTAEQWPSTLRAYCIGNAAFYVKHIRCGDRVAAARLGRSILKLMVRQVRHLIDRRRPSQAAHLRAYFDGARESLRYPVDRDRRLYLPRGAAVREESAA